MKIGVFGTGNTASGLVLNLASWVTSEQVVVVGRVREKALATILDAASAYPAAAAQFSVGDLSHLSECEVVIVTAGAQIPKGAQAKSVIGENSEILQDAISNTGDQLQALIVLATPVDDITSIAAVELKDTSAEVMGFGGDLDTARLVYQLSKLGRLPANPVYAIGEHGGRAIPVYPGEHDFDEVKSSVSGLLKNVTKMAGPPRNLATGVLLSELVRTVCQRLDATHVISTYDPKTRTSVTWPHKFADGKKQGKLDLEIGPRASEAYQDLMLQKGQEAEEVLSHTAKKSK